MIVEINHIDEAKKFIRRINSKDIREIQWFQNGQPIVVPEEAYQNFEMYGLSNIDFPYWLNYKPETT